MKIALLGDSITQGLGSKKINFQNALQNQLEQYDKIVNMAQTGTVINYVYNLFEKIEQEGIDCAIIIYGNVDAMLKPNRRGLLFKRLPKRYTMNEGSMLLPRPFYSHSFFKRSFQKIENVIRIILRNMIFLVDGTEQWMPIDQYKKDYEKICTWLIEKGITPVICSTVFIDNNLFPGTVQEYQEYNRWMESYAKTKGLLYIDFYNLFRLNVKQSGWMEYYNHDHFHPNGNGYLIMATEIAKSIECVRKCQ